MQHEYKCDQCDQYHNQNWCLERGRKEQEKQINKYKTLMDSGVPQKWSYKNRVKIFFQTFEERNCK